MESNKDHPVLFGKYEILEELGRGGFGLFTCFDTVLKLSSTIKELYPTWSMTPPCQPLQAGSTRCQARSLTSCQCTTLAKLMANTTLPWATCLVAR